MPLIPALLALVGQVAPSLISLLAGDKAGAVAERVVDLAQTVTGAPTQEAAAEALKADPGKLADLQIRLAEISLDAEKARQSDAANARAREITTHDWTPRALAIAATCGLFGLMGVMAFHEIPVANQQALNILFGSLGAGWAAVLSYYFGASASGAGAAARPFVGK